MGEKNRRKKKPYARSGRQVLLDAIGRDVRIDPETQEERAVLNMSDAQVSAVLKGKPPEGRKKWVEAKMQERWQTIEHKIRDDVPLTQTEKILVARAFRIKDKTLRVSYEPFAKAWTDRREREINIRKLL